jgi:hypothetical protein
MDPSDVLSRLVWGHISASQGATSLISAIGGGAGFWRPIMKTTVFLTLAAISLFAVGATFSAVNPAARPCEQVAQVAVDTGSALS